jgi:hypothetical protein
MDREAVDSGYAADLVREFCGQSRQGSFLWEERHGETSVSRGDRDGGVGVQ